MTENLREFAKKGDRIERGLESPAPIKRFVSLQSTQPMPIHYL